MKKIFTLFLLLLANYAAFCQWSTSPTINNLVCTGTNNQYASRVVSDGSGGAIFTWFDYTAATNDYNIYAQRINSAGIVQWTANGVSICTDPGLQSPPEIISDGNGGAIIVWQDNRDFYLPAIYAQRINASGIVQWTPDGVSLSDGVNGQTATQLISDGNGGAIIIWKVAATTFSKINAQRINANGIIQWGTEGVSMTTSTTPERPQVISDGAGGAIISWNEYVGIYPNGFHHIYAQRINSGGITQWGATGTLVCNAINGQVGSQLTSDGSNGAIIIWEDYRNSPTYPGNIYAQRVNAAGVIQWIVDGIAVAPITLTQSNPKILTDGGGGAYITWWLSNNTVWVQRINSSGIAQWAAAGIRISTASNSRAPEIATDGGTGAIITWYTVSSANIYAQRINTSGVIQWVANGVNVCTDPLDQTDPHIAANGSGGAIVSWTDNRNNAADGSDIYASLLNSDGTPGTISSTGLLDPTFGTGGKVTTSIGNVSGIKAMAIQADGKIVAAGLSHTASNKDFGVARYNTNGTLDNSFDADGKVITAIGAGNFDDIALCIAIQADGKIVTAGYTFNGTDDDFVLVRYNTDGSLDNSFDGDGILTTSFGAANNAVINAIAIQADGKIVVAGYIYSGTDNDFALARYNTDGSLDNSFDGDGKVQTSIGVSNDLIYSMVLQSDGKIVVAGVTYTAGNADFALARYNTNGSLDNTFDADGKVITAIGSSGDIASSIALQSDGKLVVAGQSYNGSDNDFALARYNINGSLDNSFDGDGKLTSPIGPFGDNAYAVAIQADGKIIAAGYCETLSTNNDFALARYNTDGSLDNSFDGDGKVITNINGFDNIYAMKLSASRIYAGGVSNDDIFTLVAYQNDATPIILPLQLTSFIASRQGNNIELFWQTASEQNTSHFDIERSTDGSHFLKIGEVQATGNSSSSRNYFFTDQQPITGTDFYRLKMSDADGRFTYSKVVVVKINSLAQVEIFPNPVRDVLQLQITSGQNGNIILQIQNVEGKIIKQQTIPSTGNQLSTAIDVSMLSKGIYFIVVKKDSGITMKKFIKQ